MVPQQFGTLISIYITGISLVFLVNFLLQTRNHTDNLRHLFFKMGYCEKTEQKKKCVFPFNSPFLSPPLFITKFSVKKSKTRGGGKEEEGTNFRRRGR
jgi:hypothetical protein